jgi:hypothetical protein
MYANYILEMAVRRKQINADLKGLDLEGRPAFGAQTMSGTGTAYLLIS